MYLNLDLIFLLSFLKLSRSRSKSGSRFYICKPKYLDQTRTDKKISYNVVSFQTFQATAHFHKMFKVSLKYPSVSEVINPHARYLMSTQYNLGTNKWLYLQLYVYTRESSDCYPNNKINNLKLSTRYLKLFHLNENLRSRSTIIGPEGEWTMKLVCKKQKQKT